MKLTIGVRALGLVVALLLCSSRSEAAVITVDGRAEIFAAGLTTTPASVDRPGTEGLLPDPIDLPTATGRTLTFSSVTGTMGPISGNPSDFHGPDGKKYSNVSTDLNSVGGISGIIDSVTLPLVGVFLTAATPSSPAPARLDFTNNHDFTTLSPLIGQTFFIGDGKTTGGVTQIFNIPDDATRLYLGFADGVNFIGEPNSYADNFGSFTATYQVPEPGAGLAVAGITLLLARRRCRRTGGIGACD